MGFEEFLDMAPHTVSIEQFTGEDAFGLETYGAAVPVRARIQGKVKLLRGMDGEETVSTVQVYIGPTPAVGPDDRITLPAGFLPAQPAILAVERVSDEAALHHQVVMC